MQNRFLSRGKRIDNGEWVEGYLYGIWERRYILWGMTNDIPNMVEVDPETVCQCTAMPDKNNKLTVSLEDYSIVDDAGEGFDTTVKIKLKQYREFITKTCTVDISLPKPQAAMQQTRAAGNAPSGGSYTVVSGDCLWKIAKQFYGDGGKWSVIYNANKSVIGGNPNLIYPGQVLTIPAA